jgi:hypothetical protein
MQWEWLRAAVACPEKVADFFDQDTRSFIELARILFDQMGPSGRKAR